jgi:hypothetical protein
MIHIITSHINSSFYTGVFAYVGAGGLVFAAVGIGHWHPVKTPHIELWVTVREVECQFACALVWLVLLVRLLSLRHQRLNQRWTHE